MKTKLVNIVWIMFLFAFYSCNFPKTEKAEIQQESETVVANEKQATADKVVSIEDAWGNDELGNAYFAFYEDSIYYPDPNLWYKYDIVGDTIRIFKESNQIEKLLIKKLDKDSLVVEYLDYQIIESYKRRK